MRDMLGKEIGLGSRVVFSRGSTALILGTVVAIGPKYVHIQYEYYGRDIIAKRISEEIVVV